MDLIHCILGIIMSVTTHWIQSIAVKIIMLWQARTLALPIMQLLPLLWDRVVWQDQQTELPTMIKCVLICNPAWSACGRVQPHELFAYIIRPWQRKQLCNSLQGHTAQDTYIHISACPLVYYNICFTFWLKYLVFILRTFSTYSPRGLSASPPPEERKPKTMSIISNVSQTLSNVCSSANISCCTCTGRRSYRKCYMMDTNTLTLENKVTSTWGGMDSPGVTLSFWLHQIWQMCKCLYGRWPVGCQQVSSAFHGWIDPRGASQEPWDRIWQCGYCQQWGNSGSETREWTAVAAHRQQRDND